MRFEQQVVRNAFSKWGVKSGSVWYFREGTVVEVSAEKPPFVYVKREDGGLVSNLKEAVMELAGLRKNHRVITEGSSKSLSLFIKLDIPEKEREIRVAGVWLLVKGSKGKWKLAYTISELANKAVDYIRQSLSGDEFMEHVASNMGDHPVIRAYLKKLRSNALCGK